MAEMKEKQKRKVNNSGMTLVEILVAIAILTVVSMGLLQAFVSAVKYNRDAKDKQRAINLAQSVMESCKAYSLEDIYRQFNGVGLTFGIYKGTVGSYSGLGGSINPDHTFAPSVDNKYTFKMENVQYDGKLYNVDIALQPNAMPASVENVAKTPKFSVYNDAIFSQPSDEYKYVYQDVINELKNAGMKIDQLPTLTTLDTDKVVINERKLEITMFNNSGAECVTAAVSYKYTIDKYEITKDDGTKEEFTGTFTTTVDGSDDSTTYNVYDNTVTIANGARLDNVFIYYYPAYNNNYLGSACEKDDIIITNNTGKTRNVYLVKQAKPGLSGASLYNSEQSYHPNVTLLGSSGINLYHNMLKKLGGGVVSANISARSAGSAVDSLHEEWYDEESKIMVYDVVVTVTDLKKGTVEMVLNGSINDK